MIIDPICYHSLGTGKLEVFHATLVFPQSFNLLVLDNGALPPAKRGLWPAAIASVFLLQLSPALHPVRSNGVISKIQELPQCQQPLTCGRWQSVICTHTTLRWRCNALTGRAYLVQVV